MLLLFEVSKHCLLQLLLFKNQLLSHFLFPLCLGKLLLVFVFFCFLFFVLFCFLFCFSSNSSCLILNYFSRLLLLLWSLLTFPLSLRWLLFLRNNFPIPLCGLDLLTLSSIAKSNSEGSQRLFCWPCFLLVFLFFFIRTRFTWSQQTSQKPREDRGTNTAFRFKAFFFSMVSLSLYFPLADHTGQKLSLLLLNDDRLFHLALSGNQENKYILLQCIKQNADTCCSKA